MSENLQDRISGFVSDLVSTMASFIKTALLSRRAAPEGVARERPVVVLGNGPSLSATLTESPEWLMASDRIAVNFAANAPQFAELHPEWYVLADNHFFSGFHTDANVERLWENLSKVMWPMTLYVPIRHYACALDFLGQNTMVTVKGFNLTPAEGWKCAVHPLYRRGLAMPRPRNVMIPAIMLAMREGYNTIYLAGADHSWSRTLWVDDKNRVVSVQPHFYKDDSKELDRVAQEYAGYHLHDILHSLTVAFRSYHQIEAYARERGVRIINKTPGSFIDAFDRE